MKSSVAEWEIEGVKETERQRERKQARTTKNVMRLTKVVTNGENVKNKSQEKWPVREKVKYENKRRTD